MSGLPRSRTAINLKKGKAMNIKSKAWEEYEAGLEYKRRIGLYSTVRQNERFYRGDQWYDSHAEDLPKPVFNIVRRITDYLICSIASSEISIRYVAEALPFLTRAADAETLRLCLEGINKNASHRWEKNRMNKKIYDALSDAAISGDGVFFCYWDPDVRGAQEYSGDVATEVIDSVNVFPADVNRRDIQSQEYIILSGRQSVANLREEARRNGVPEEEISKIVPDKTEALGAGSMSDFELGGASGEKATYIIKFWRENGHVVFEKSTKECVIRRVHTDCKLYPIAYFNWHTAKNSFHGASPISALIPNQKYLNRAYALAMKHMTDTAFSKVVYDKSRIPEWSNGVGEAIAVVGGGNVADSVSVIGVGEMQDGYLTLISTVTEQTKELSGATEAALGDEQAQNTSAILALQEVSKVSLGQVRNSFYQCLEDLANIWADMMCAYYPESRLLTGERDGEPECYQVSFSLLKNALISARVDVCEVNRYSSSSTQSTLDKLLDGGHISPAEYVRRLPSGLINDREELIDMLEEKNKKKGSTENE